jgi:hypothetical protein
VTNLLLVANILIATFAFYAQSIGSIWLLAGLLVSGAITVFILINTYGKRRMKMVDGTLGNGFAKGKIRFISYITKEAANQN